MVELGVTKANLSSPVQVISSVHMAPRLVMKRMQSKRRARSPGPHENQQPELGPTQIFKSTEILSNSAHTRPSCSEQSQQQSDHERSKPNHLTREGMK